MGTGYKGNSISYRRISENLSMLKSEYNYDKGYFFEQGKGRDYTRNSYSADPLKMAIDFYDKISYGGLEQDLKNGKGQYTKMADGTIITFRKTSSSDGSPAIDINISYSNDTGGIKKQKIHFGKEKK